jgi:hypothetical protein
LLLLLLLHYTQIWQKNAYASLRMIDIIIRSAL